MGRKLVGGESEAGQFSFQLEDSGRRVLVTCHVERRRTSGGALGDGGRRAQQQDRDGGVECHGVASPKTLSDLSFLHPSQVLSEGGNAMRMLCGCVRSDLRLFASCSSSSSSSSWNCVGTLGRFWSFMDSFFIGRGDASMKMG